MEVEEGVLQHNVLLVRVFDEMILPQEVGKKLMQRAFSTVVVA